MDGWVNGSAHVKLRGLNQSDDLGVPQGNSTGVWSSWVTSNIRGSDNKHKSFLSRSWTIYLYKHNIGVIDRKLNDWLPGKFKMFSLNKLLHGWLLPTWGSSPCRLTLVSDRAGSRRSLCSSAYKKLKRDRTKSLKWNKPWPSRDNSIMDILDILLDILLKPPQPLMGLFLCF